MKRTEPEPETQPISSDEIIAIVEDIAAAGGVTLKDRQRIYRNKYPEFAENYPVLFEMSTQDSFDLPRLKFMIRLRDKIDKSEITQYDASAAVGQNLYNTYVHDKIKDVPPTK